MIAASFRTGADLWCCEPPPPVVRLGACEAKLVDLFRALEAMFSPPPSGPAEGAADADEIAPPESDAPPAC